MLHIETQGTGVILPAFAVGYEVGDDVEAERVFDAAPFDTGGPLVVLEPQVGGYSTGLRSVAGAVLRLAANSDKAHRPLDIAIRGFTAMAEDPDQLLLAREYPALHQLVYTVGDPYAAADLHRLQAFLRRFLHVPNLAAGVEAFLRFEPCEPMTYFADWRVMSYRMRPDRRGSPYANLPPNRYIVEAGNMSDVLLADDEPFDATLLERLHNLGRRLRRDDPPGVFFLWENSD